LECVITNILCIFAAEFWWCFFHPEKTLKRESGVNPEQTRCCKLNLSERNNTFATEKSGRRFVKRVSQKTCQNKLSKSFRGIELETNKAGWATRIFHQSYKFITKFIVFSEAV